MRKNLIFFTVKVVKQCDRGCKFSILGNFQLQGFGLDRNPWAVKNPQEFTTKKINQVRIGFRGRGREQGQQSLNQSKINLYSGMQAQLRGLDYLPFKPPQECSKEVEASQHSLKMDNHK